MNRKIITIAAIAMMATLATSCQKENLENGMSMTEAVQGNEVSVVQFTLDGTDYRITLHNEEERMSFIHTLVALAKEGHDVYFFDSRASSQNIATKDVVTYVTSDEDDATAWANKMMLNGYHVHITYDEDKGLYTCVAYN